MSPENHELCLGGPDETGPPGPCLSQGKWTVKYFEVALGESDCDLEKNH